MFTFRLEHADGTPADPPTLRAAVPNWAPGDTIPGGSRRPTLRVMEVRPGTEAGQVAVMVVEAALPQAAAS